MGPAVLNSSDNFDVDQHPHVGLCTLTYLFEGAVEHRDSTGAYRVIQAGDVGLMTAGRGVAHTERTPEELRKVNNRKMHGYQIWLALPTHLEEMEPRFDYVANDDHPKWKERGLELKLLAGNGFNRTSALPVHSELFLVELKAIESTSLNLSDCDLTGEIGIIVISGAIQLESETINQNNLLYMESAKNEIQIEANSHLLLLGGEPFPEERFLLWNFVSSSKERLEKARKDWINKEFPAIPGDNTYVPFPT